MSEQVETFSEQWTRVNQMASGNPTWDLSENDLVALNAVLVNYESLWSALQRAREALKANEDISGTWDLYQHSPEMKAINAALAKAEGRSHVR